MERDKEEWRIIPSFPYYEISNYGIVRRIKKARGSYTGKIVKPFGDRYLVIGLHNNGHRTNKTIHGLVLEAFVGPKPDGHEAHHINGNKKDNYYKNLEYMPFYQHRSMFKGEDNHNAILTNAEVILIKNLRKAGNTYKHIASIVTGINWKTIAGICSGRHWTHIKAEGK